MRKLALGVMIGVVLSFLMMGFAGKPVMAEQSRIQVQDYFKVPNTITHLVISCDTANGNLVYMYYGRTSHGGNSPSIAIERDKCTKTGQ